MAELLRGDLVPCGPRLLIVDPPANNQRPSGLFLPHGVGDTAIGIVLRDGRDPEDALRGVAVVHEGCGVPLPPGAAVYYPKGACIELRDDYKIIDIGSVFAWEMP